MTLRARSRSGLAFRMCQSQQRVRGDKTRVPLTVYNAGSLARVKVGELALRVITNERVAVAIAHDSEPGHDVLVRLDQLRDRAYGIATHEYVRITKCLGQAYHHLRIGFTDVSQFENGSTSDLRLRMFQFGDPRFDLRPPARMGPRCSRLHPETATSAIKTQEAVLFRSIATAASENEDLLDTSAGRATRVAEYHLGADQYESELMTSPPARVPRACKMRLEGV